MQNHFRTKLMIVMIIFSFSLSFTISYIDIERVRDKLTEENNQKLALIEENILHSLSAVDDALFLFDNDVAKTMEENTELLLKKYEQNPEFATWDFDELSKEFNMDVYILDAENRIIHTNYPDDLTMEFPECCVKFDKLLDDRRMAGGFYHDGLDIQQQTGGLKKFSYQGTPDKKYIIELGVSLETDEVLSRFNFLDVVEKMEQNYAMIDKISVFNDEGYKLGRTIGEVRISEKHLKHLMRSLELNKRISTVELVDGKAVKRRYVPYEAKETRGSSTDRVIEIAYNANELTDTLSEMHRGFIIQLFVTLGLSVLVSIIISFLISKPMHLAFYDALTGIKNRASYEIMARRALSRKRKTGFLLLDLDNFKQVNDQLGHDTGDMLLKYVADILLRVTPDNSTPFRLGGDEFVVLVENVSDADELETLAHLLIEEIGTPSTTSDASKDSIQPGARYKHMADVIRTMNVSISIGGAIAPEHGNDLEELFKKADTALYRRKAKGKNGYAYYGNVEKNEENQ